MTPVMEELLWIMERWTPTFAAVEELIGFDWIA